MATGLFIGVALCCVLVSHHVAADRTEVMLGKGCDLTGADKTKSTCGVNAHCQRLSRYCRLGVCSCPTGYLPLRGNQWDCNKELKIGDSCTPGDTTQSQLIPEAAYCNSTTMKVVCGDPIRPKGGPCSADTQDISIVKAYHAACDNQSKTCNKIYQLSCQYSELTESNRCDCENYFYMISGICISPGLGDLCTNHDQCNHPFGPGSKALSCDVDEGIFTRCRCNATGGYKTASYSVLGASGQVATGTFCTNNPTTRALIGKNCSSGVSMIGSVPFCAEGLTCQQCPEFDQPFGYCSFGNTALRICVSGWLFALLLAVLLLC